MKTKRFFSGLMVITLLFLPLYLAFAENYDQENDEISNSTESDESSDEETSNSEDESADNEDSSEEDEEAAVNKEKAKKLKLYLDIWLRDSKKIKKLIKKARKYKSSDNDSSLQAKHKAKLLAKSIRKINKTAKNKLLKIEAVRFKDVEEEKVLSKYGIRKAKAIVRKLRKSPQGKMMLSIYGNKIKDNFILAMVVGMQMGSCKKCWRKTGLYIAEFEIPKPQTRTYYDEGENESPYDDYSSGIFDSKSEHEEYSTMSVEIKKVLRSKSKAMSLKKGKVMPLRGKIINIEYKAEYSESVKILLK